MAIKTFKEIIDNKGYRINSKDRDIFQKGNLQSFFGFSDSDMIEFILYDVNDNQLPQGNDGKLVRYIKLSSDNIRDYILIPEGTLFQALEFPKEYFIDIERLIKESGYNNGIFKTQITLLNKRVGYDSQSEKLWIKEVSPSRLEVKLLPIKNNASKQTDLLERFNIFVNGRGFRDDVVSTIGRFIESIKPAEIDLFIKNTYSEKWYNKMTAEFGISEFDRLMSQLYSKFAEAMKNEFSNRVSSINDVNFGKPKQTTASTGYNKQDVFKIAQKILIECIERYLPNRTIQTQTEVDNVFDESLDKVGSVISTRTSDVTINPKAGEVMVTKTKETKPEEVILDIKIKGEVPREEVIPNFKKPNPKKTKKRGFLSKFRADKQRVSRIKTQL
tara:strand:- start:138 stop:1298 length:1161 start_codon:yes stop_codon:yes gene_type:complete